MKKNLLKHTLVIAALSTLTITACTNKTVKESSTVSPTEAKKESSAPNPTESGATTESEKEKAENNSGSLVGAYNTNKLFYKG